MQHSAPSGQAGHEWVREVSQAVQKCEEAMATLQVSAGYLDPYAWQRSTCLKYETVVTDTS